ncbi:MAG TPA: hypothetical protein VIM16_19600 [Mucilaginibacter sp.]|jgi:hypothetical protein
METHRETLITGKEGGPIELNLAASWTKNYRDKHPGETISQFFGKEILEKILAQKNCLGIRFYYAHDKPLNRWQRCVVSVSNFILKVVGNIDGHKHLIIVGVMADGADQIGGKEHEAVPERMTAAEPLVATTDSTSTTIGDLSAPCPGSPGCPTNTLTGV